MLISLDPVFIVRDRIIVSLVFATASGTHTGAPYGFGPYPAIEATGRVVLNDPEEATITIDEKTGLITNMRFVAKGCRSGPPGFYEQIGGLF